MMVFPGACCSITPTPGVWFWLFFSVWNIWKPLYGSVTLLWNLKCESPLLSSLSEMVRSKYSFSSSTLFSSKVVQDFFIYFLRLFLSDLFDLLDFLDILVLDFSSSCFLAGVSLDFFGNEILGALSFHSCSTSYIYRAPCHSVHMLIVPVALLRKFHSF